MVDEQIVARRVTSGAVVAAMRSVPRHRFVPAALTAQAYQDKALGLGPGQSISQPYIVALMTDLASPAPSERVLEVGSGSGYQAAVLAELAEAVYTVEVDAELAAAAADRLAQLGYRNVHVRCADGRVGWPDAAPFGAILVTACGEAPPATLVEQLADGGRLVMPIRRPSGDQVLRLYRRSGDGALEARDVIPVRFVTLT